MLLLDLQGKILDFVRFSKSYEKGKGYYLELADMLERFLDKNNVERERFLGLEFLSRGL